MLSIRALIDYLLWNLHHDFLQDVTHAVSNLEVLHDCIRVLPKEITLCFVKCPARYVVLSDQVIQKVGTDERFV